MSYHRPPPSPWGRASGRGGALGALGDDVMSGTIWAVPPYDALVAQINRFGEQAPADVRFAITPFELAGGNLTPELALVAVSIFQRRAAAAYEQFHDAGSMSAITRANLGYADPVAFVQANLTEVLAAIQGYADSLGLPAASGGILGAVSSSKLLICAGVGAALWLLTRKARP